MLVCVKRVPMVGGRIMLTEDGQEVDTRMSGFTVSPHEECAVEEAVQITERVGGTVTVLTLGPPEADGQLRDMLALGAGRAMLLETGRSEWGPQSTAAAIAAAARATGRATTCCCSATRRPTPAATRSGAGRARAGPALRHRDQDARGRPGTAWSAAPGVPGPQERFGLPRPP